MFWRAPSRSAYVLALAPSVLGVFVKLSVLATGFSDGSGMRQPMSGRRADITLMRQLRENFRSPNVSAIWR